MNNPVTYLGYTIEVQDNGAHYSAVVTQDDRVVHTSTARTADRVMCASLEWVLACVQRRVNLFIEEEEKQGFEDGD